MKSHIDDMTTVRVFDASTSRALMAEQDGRVLFFFPFSDIYFEFLKRSPERPSDSAPSRDWWDVSAVGEGHEHAMWSLNETAPEIGRLKGHGCFDPEAVAIEASQTESGENSTELP